MEDDIIIKQGDLTGNDEYVYIIIEGLAEVIQEKRDFCYFDLDSTSLFFRAHMYDTSNLDIANNIKSWINKYKGQLPQSGAD